MNKILFEYKFRCGACEKVYTDPTNKCVFSAPCPDCGESGERVKDSFPTLKADINSDKWVKNRESHMRQEQRNLKSFGDYK